MLVGLTAAIIRYLRPHEIVDPIEANALYGGRMSMWDSLNLTLITVITVSFGGSAGLEAAYTQAGLRFRLEDRAGVPAAAQGLAPAGRMRIGRGHLRRL